MIAHTEVGIGGPVYIQLASKLSTFPVLKWTIIFQQSSIRSAHFKTQWLVLKNGPAGLKTGWAANRASTYTQWWTSTKPTSCMLLDLVLQRWHQVMKDSDYIYIWLWVLLGNIHRKDMVMIIKWSKSLTAFFARHGTPQHLPFDTCLDLTIPHSHSISVSTLRHHALLSDRVFEFRF